MTTVLTVRVPNIGTERYALSLYDADGGGHQEWLASEFTLTTFVNLVVEWSQGADFVCVDVTGVGAALADLLEDRHVGVLCMRRGRPLNREAGAEPPQARVRGAGGDVQREGDVMIDRAKLEEAIKMARRGGGDISSGVCLQMTVGELHALADAAEAHLAALPKTAMVAVWHIEFASYGKPVIWTRTDRGDADSAAADMRKVGTDQYQCVRVTGPHRQEVPA